jgi:hypothetical protein
VANHVTNGKALVRGKYFILENFFMEAESSGIFFSCGAGFGLWG